MLLDVLLVIGVLLVCILLTKKYSRFKDAGVPSATPFPLLGSTWKSFMGQCHIVEDLQNLYQHYGDDKSRFVGFYNMIFPSILLKDPQMIKQIIFKDYQAFNEHMMIITEAVEPLFGRNLVSLTGKKWRDMRATLSPAFTSSKMRDMYAFVTECGKHMTDYTFRQIKKNKENYGFSELEVELRDFGSCYMTDIISSSAYGIKVDCFNDRNNQFYKRAEYFSKFTVYQFFKLMLGNMAPKLARFLDVRLFDKDNEIFFKDVVLSTMKYREEHNIVRRDMIHLLMQAKKGSLKHDDTVDDKESGYSTVQESDVGKGDVKTMWTDDDFVAQAIIFFFAGYHTSSTLMSYVLYEIAINENVQKRLQDEIDSEIAKNGTEVSYETLHAMKYLDMVITEGLRKWPPLPMTDRVALKDVNLGPIREGESKTFTIKKGEVVCISIYSIHHDSRFWKDPEIFNPERFSDENKDNVQPYTYLPFGGGPRNCIGSRFALMQSKAMLFHLLADFNVQLSPKTKVPLEFDVTSIPFLRASGGMWVKFLPRKLTI